jgi:SAM-dependent methyltransferase
LPDAVQEQNEAAEHFRRFADLAGDERVLVAGSGLASLLELHVREVVEVEAARLTELPLPRGAFDLAATVGTLRHVRRPELAVAELVRVTRPGGLLLVADQLAPVDPLAALELNRFEQARDPTHARTLADVDLRSLFEANGLVLRRAEVVRERRDLDEYLDLAGCEGADRERARGLAPGPSSYVAEVGWYVLVKPGFGR